MEKKKKKEIEIKPFWREHDAIGITCKLPFSQGRTNPFHQAKATHDPTQVTVPIPKFIKTSSYSLSWTHLGLACIGVMGRLVSPWTFLPLRRERERERVQIQTPRWASAEGKGGGLILNVVGRAVWGSQRWNDRNVMNAFTDMNLTFQILIVRMWFLFLKSIAPHPIYKPISLFLLAASPLQAVFAPHYCLPTYSIVIKLWILLIY